MNKWLFRAVGTVGLAGGFLVLAGTAAQAGGAETGRPAVDPVQRFPGLLPPGLLAPGLLPSDVQPTLRTGTVSTALPGLGPVAVDTTGGQARPPAVGPRHAAPTRQHAAPTGPHAASAGRHATDERPASLGRRIAGSPTGRAAERPVVADDRDFR